MGRPLLRRSFFLARRTLGAISDPSGERHAWLRLRCARRPGRP
ncbi:Hypothetical protein A7982_05766 [Minicystis rosea]|nr:Hypothetical protein A7982_05766 [Minicystis rosea]